MESLGFGWSIWGVRLRLCIGEVVQQWLTFLYLGIGSCFISQQHTKQSREDGEDGSMQEGEKKKLEIEIKHTHTHTHTHTK